MDNLTERLEVGGDVEVGKTKGVVKNVLKCVEGSDKGVLFFLLRRGRKGEREREREGQREGGREREKERGGGGGKTEGRSKSNTQT